MNEVYFAHDYFKYFLNVHMYIFKRSENNLEIGHLLNILMWKK